MPETYVDSGVNYASQNTWSLPGTASPKERLNLLGDTVLSKCSFIWKKGTCKHLK